MDIESLKKYSDLSFDRAIAKKNALERAQSRIIFAYRDHLFRADAETINLAHVLKQQHEKFFMLDINKNPCEIYNIIINSKNIFITLKRKSILAILIYY